MSTPSTTVSRDSRFLLLKLMRLVGFFGRESFSLSLCVVTMFLLRLNMPPLRRNFRANFPFPVGGDGRLIRRLEGRVLASVYRVLVRVSRPRSATLSIREILFRRLLFGTRTRRCRVFIMRILRRDHTSTNMNSIMRRATPIRFLNVRRFRHLHPIFLQSRRRPILNNTKMTTVSKFQLPRRFARTINMSRTRLLVRRTAGRITVTMRRVVLKLNQEMERIMFLQVRSFVCFIRGVR